MKRSLLAASAATLAIAAPAMAQDLCGGEGANGQWIGGTEAASDVTAAGSHMEQMALVLANNAYTALFSVSAPTDVRVEAQGRGGGDPVIDLRDAAGTILLSDDDSGGEGSSFAEATLEPGTYCLSMQSYDGSPMTGFVRVGRTEHEPLTNGGSMPTDVATDVATDVISDVMDSFNPAGGGCTEVANFLSDGPIDQLLGSGAMVTASVDQVDAWGFTLSSPQAVTITAENEDADPVITLYDGAGNYLAENDDYDGLNSRIDMSAPLDPGDYCIEMTALSDSAQPITVSVTGFDPMAEVEMLIANGEASPPMDGSYPITDLGELSTRLRHDAQISSEASWFSFTVSEGGLVLLEAVANGNGDPVAYLYDDIGRMVAMNDDNGQSYDSMIAARVLPGTYLLGVRQFDESAQSLIRLVMERYVPAR